MKRFFIRFIFIFIALLALVGIFSSTESQFECTGVMRGTRQATQSTLNLRLTQYRWWVKFWNDSDGMLKIEIQAGHPEWFLYLNRAGDQLMIARDIGATFSGHYSMGSKHLNLLTGSGEFSGECRLLQ